MSEMFQSANVGCANLMLPEMARPPALRKSRWTAIYPYYSVQSPYYRSILHIAYYMCHTTYVILHVP